MPVEQRFTCIGQSITANISNLFWFNLLQCKKSLSLSIYFIIFDITKLSFNFLLVFLNFGPFNFIHFKTYKVKY